MNPPRPTTPTTSTSTRRPAPSTIAPLTATLLPTGTELRLTPDALARRLIDAPAEAIPRVGLFDWQPAGDGTFRPIVRLHESLVKASELAPLVGINYLTLHRLIRAGFVEGSQPSPQVILVDATSYFAHQEAAKDPDFWTPERRLKYSAVI